MIIILENATGRDKIPFTKRADPINWVVAALKVQRDGSPGRKPKERDQMVINVSKVDELIKDELDQMWFHII